MTVFTKCVSVLVIISFTAHVAYYHELAISQISLLVNVTTETASLPVKIVLWTGSLKNHKSDRIQKRKLDRVQKFVDELNKQKNGICRAIQEDELVVKNFHLDNDEPGHCEFAMSADNETVADVDAIAFYMFNHGFKLSELPQLENRNSKQIWVMYTIEPPYLSIWRDPLRNLMNWTMSYRRDSDIWVPYGRYVQRNTTDEKDLKFNGGTNLDQWIKQKSKLIFGVNSHCRTDSLREKLIAEMNNTGIQVDLFGGCGRPTCARYATNCNDYWEKFAKEYKFYMAFENSLCKDYITEKFWRSLDLGVVPVVFGGGNYELEAPPGSYINAREFASADALMKYLQYLNGNQAEYAKYFEWKHKYKLPKYWDTFIADWCSLCRAVKKYKIEGMRSSKTYGNLKYWWTHMFPSNKPICTSKPKTFFDNS